ncbi:hypothetical protein NEDG_01538 [Nematocida displodere]|uniref:Uncharacterized protein n=1 Tax=Nematocida displodere TaxID=1805483 RepID=A0A177EET4_9MICR|nr:hypothetical protein NEDG_01538 [Nematocida displodere]
MCLAKCLKTPKMFKSPTVKTLALAGLAALGKAKLFLCAQEAVGGVESLSTPPKQCVAESLDFYTRCGNRVGLEPDQNIVLERHRDVLFINLANISIGQVPNKIIPVITDYSTLFFQGPRAYSSTSQSDGWSCFKLILARMKYLDARHIYIRDILFDDPSHRYQTFSMINVDVQKTCTHTNKLTFCNMSEYAMGYSMFVLNISKECLNSVTIENSNINTLSFLNVYRCTTIGELVLCNLPSLEWLRCRLISPGVTIENLTITGIKPKKRLSREIVRILKNNVTGTLCVPDWIQASLSDKELD